MIDLDRALTELAHRLDVPGDERVVATVLERIGATETPRPRRRRLVATVAGVGIVAVGVLPGPRGAIARWLGFDSVHIEPNVTVPTTPSTPVALGLGESTTMAAARAATGLPDPTPLLLGPADSVHVVQPPRAGEIVLVYASSDLVPASPVTGVGALVAVLPAHIEEGFFTKALGNDATERSVDVGGVRGYWIEGSPHQVLFETTDGMDFDSLRLATNTLLWERSDVVYRIEADVTLDVALRIAASIGS